MWPPITKAGFGGPLLAHSPPLDYMDGGSLASPLPPLSSSSVVGLRTSGSCCYGLKLQNPRLFLLAVYLRMDTQHKGPYPEAPPSL